MLKWVHLREQIRWRRSFAAHRLAAVHAAAAPTAAANGEPVKKKKKLLETLVMKLL